MKPKITASKKLGVLEPCPTARGNKAGADCLQPPAHTPGPWFVRPDSFWNPKADNEHFHVCTSPDGGVDIAYAVNGEANAHLVAAVPDLLEAAKAALEMLAEISHYVPDEEFDDPLGQNVNKMRDRLTAAIAKATA